MKIPDKIQSIPSRPESEQQKGRRESARLFRLCDLLVLALLVGDSAGSLAGRLARGLALTAATLGGTGLQGSPVQRLDMFHLNFSSCLVAYSIFSHSKGIITQYIWNFNHLLRFFLDFLPSSPGIAPPHRQAHKIPAPPLATEVSL